MSSVANHHVSSNTYVFRNKERSIPSGYRKSNQFRVFPPMTERMIEIQAQSNRDGKAPQPSAIETAKKWEEVSNHVSKYNSIPSSASDNTHEVELHKWLLKENRLSYITQDGVAEWKPVYEKGVGVSETTKHPVAYVNSRNNRAIVADRNTPKPPPIYFDQLVSTAEFADNLSPEPMTTNLKTTENRPGMGK